MRSSPTSVNAAAVVTSGADTPRTAVSAAGPAGTRNLLVSQAAAAGEPAAAVSVEVRLRREAMEQLVAAGVDAAVRAHVCAALLLDPRRLAIAGPFPPAWNFIRVTFLPAPAPPAVPMRTLDPAFDPRTAAQLAGDLFRLLARRNGPLASSLGAVRAVLVDEPAQPAGASGALSAGLSESPGSAAAGRLKAPALPALERRPAASVAPVAVAPVADAERRHTPRSDDAAAAARGPGRSSGLAAQLVYGVARLPPPLPPPPSAKDRHMSRRRAEVRSRWRRLARKQQEAVAAAAAAAADPRLFLGNSRGEKGAGPAGRAGDAGVTAEGGADAWRRYESRSNGRAFWHNWATGAYSWTPP
jgi:hypothetical protein